ncbi:MAG TPA: hypothetical protein P5514_15610 [Bacteroidales bacterium]|nr:hypothetical protein [Bacteroidales bacterium]HRX98372.1 hypothetical protein [Bacteroidales bacterium]
MAQENERQGAIERSLQRANELVRTTIYDLTHLEINTIVKDEMNASKAPDNAWLLLNSIAAKFHKKLKDYGNKYQEEIEGKVSLDNEINYFRGEVVYGGCSYLSFIELIERAKSAITTIREHKSQLVNLGEDEVNADIKMLERIITISKDLRNILQTKEKQRLKRGDEKPPRPAPPGELDFDIYDNVKKFRTMTAREAEKYDLDLDLRQLMVIQKANDVGTERVVLQTIIGLDGDVTTRVSQSFVNDPVPFVLDMHQNATSTSVEFWNNLVNIVVDFGKQLLRVIGGKS